MTYKRTDDNQTQIVTDLTDYGYTVLSIASVGNGAPDIVVGCRLTRRNWLFEIKDPEKPPSKRKLTPHEEKFHAEWKGQVDIIHSTKEALDIMRAKP